MVYLIGVDHLIQYNGPVPEALRLEFREYLFRESRSHAISCIAEEFSVEALTEVYKATEATVQRTAEMLGIEHRFCDPEDRERRELGIPCYAELVDRVKNTHGIAGGFILDEKLRKTIEQESVEADRSYWHLREDFWFGRIENIITSNILFVCGHEHVERFMRLIFDRGHPCVILESFWREDIFSDYRTINLA